MKSLLALALLASPSPTFAQSVARAIATDPPHDAAHPARMEVLHIPSGGVAINGVAYVPSGAGPHPVLLIAHGLPGNEKNLDLAQAARRAGWIAVTFNYRGSWGSPGTFRFANNPADARAVIAWLRDPAHAAALGADPARIAIVGHSMGAWVAAKVSAQEPDLLGAGLISMGDMGAIGGLPRADLLALAADNLETLVTTKEAMTEELIADAAANRTVPDAAAIARHPLLALTSDDGGAPATDALVSAVRGAGGRVEARHVATDHGWSDRRILLETLVIDWLAKLR